jgi:hypothetical protein
MLKKLKIAVLFTLIAGIWACSPSMGEKFNAKKEVLEYDEFLTAFEGKDSMDAVVRGKVESVCQVKGCWMNIVSEKEGKEEMFVKFKDYAFFMPLDLSGKTVVMKGKAFREVTPVDELRHYAEDAGKSQDEIEAITEPKEELKFMAIGVIIDK